MSKTSLYIQSLQILPRGEDGQIDQDLLENYLLRESGLPGKRANIELAQAVAQVGDAVSFMNWLEWDIHKAPVNTPHEFLAFCGTLGLGRLLSEGEREYLKLLRSCANDPRWRMREAVAMALQLWGAQDMEGLITELRGWAGGTLLERRAAAAALCEPALLTEPQHAIGTLHILDKITASIRELDDRKSEAFKALRKGLGYCWSVAVVAHPETGKALMGKWLASGDPDILWIMKQNLKKNRLAHMDPPWVLEQLAQHWVD